MSRVDTHFIIPINDKPPYKYANPSPLTLKESNAMHKDSLKRGKIKPLDFSKPSKPTRPAPAAPMKVEPVDTPATTFSDICQVEVNADRLQEAIVIKFEELLQSTKDNQGPQFGAILLLVKTGDGETTELWFPKKCCKNLDLDEQTVLVWDKIVDKKGEELEFMDGFGFALQYYKEYYSEDELGEEETEEELNFGEDYP